MKTQKQIVERINSIKEADFFGFRVGTLLEMLDFEHAKPFLKEGVTESEWDLTERTEGWVKKTMLEYMGFAWGKANNCRGISAGRSMAHYQEWVWAIGDENKFGDLENYEFYGKDNLVKICEEYGWDSSKWDNGIRSNSEEY